MSNATLSNNSGTIEAQGGESVTGLTMDTAHGNVIYYGSGTYPGLTLATRTTT